MFVVLLLASCQQDKTAYMDVNTVFTEFELAKKLDKERESIISSRQTILDSIEIQLNQLSAQFKYNVDSNQVKVFNQKREEYYYKEKQFSEDNQALLLKHNEQITKQLNQYIEDFGKEKGYRYIFGANGNGSMMYADQQADISQDIITYINEKYNGL